MSPSATLEDREQVGTAADAAWGTTQAPANRFRHDIEGLRLLAITLVAVFHVWVGRVSGGVDVFLMISGFLVGGGLLRRYRSGAPLRLGPYVARLARRLLPAAVVVLASIVAATYLLLPRTRWADVAGQGLASLAYVENWWLALAGRTYGAADPGASPLQHFWSLSVQGQLFLAVPIVVVVVGGLLRRVAPRRAYALMVGLTALATAASFGYAVWAVGYDQGWAYYDTGARAWEYLVGTLLAVVLPGLRLRAGLRVVLGWVGVLAVLATGVVVDGAATFPGPWALLPVLGAVAVIAAGSSPTRVGVDRVLAWRRISGAGKYAYGLYLWHWPLLILHVEVTGAEEVGWLPGAGILLTSAVLAVLTSKYVEEPLRRSARPRPGEAPRRRRPRQVRRRRALVATMVVATGLATVAPAVWLAQVEMRQRAFAALGEDGLDPTVYPGAMAVVEPEYWPVPDGVDPVPEPVDASADVAPTGADGCVVEWNPVRPRACTYGDPDGDITVALVGGSHSEQWLPALERVAQNRGIRIVTFLKVSCPWAADPFENYPECGEWVENVEDELVELAPDAVIATSTRPAEDGDGDAVPASYLEAWERLDRRGLTIVTLRDNPWLPFYAPECLSENPDDPEACTVDRAEHLSPVDPTTELDGLPGNVVPLDLNDGICRADECRMIEGNVLVFRDAHHLTGTYIRTLAPLLEERLGAATGWW